MKKQQMNKQIKCPHCEKQFELEDGRTVKKYDEDTQIPVGYLSMLFSPKRQDLRDKYINGQEWFVINTKNNQVLGSVTFGMQIKGELNK